jgi:hypothetical protein
MMETRTIILRDDRHRDVHPGGGGFVRVAAGVWAIKNLAGIIKQAPPAVHTSPGRAWVVLRA